MQFKSMHAPEPTITMEITANELKHLIGIVGDSHFQNASLYDSLKEIRRTAGV